VRSAQGQGEDRESVEESLHWIPAAFQASPVSLCEEEDKRERGRERPTIPILNDASDDST
jgi:hypothetical protein